MFVVEVVLFPLFIANLNYRIIIWLEVRKYCCCNCWLRAHCHMQTLHTQSHSKNGPFTATLTLSTTEKDVLQRHDSILP